MPPTTPAPLLILGIALAFIALVGGTMFIVGRTVRASLASNNSAAPSPRTNAPHGLARTLTDRGLLNTRELASMSPAEREFFLTTMAEKLGDGSKPRLVAPPPAVGGAGQSAARPGETAPAAVAEQPPILPVSALVSGPIHCPVCRTLIGQRAEALLRMARCPGCSRRVGVRVEGDRLTVTVDYSLGTPATGTPRIRT